MPMSTNEDNVNAVVSSVAGRVIGLRSVLEILGETLWDWNLLTDVVFFHLAIQKSRQ